MKFTKVEISDKEYLNYIFLNAKVGDQPVTAMFDTKGNSLLKKSIADKIDIRYIDEKPIDEKRGWRRARVNLKLGGLEIGSAPIIVANDENFDLPEDPIGNKYPADFILGWNIISQLCFRGDAKTKDFEVQVDDFRENSSKESSNLPIVYIEFDGQRVLSGIDTSKPLTTVSQDIFDKILKNKDDVNTIEMIGLEDENLTYETKLIFKIDEDMISLPSAGLNPKLNEGDVKILFGADLFANTTWAMYCPMRYMRARQL